MSFTSANIVIFVIKVIPRTTALLSHIVTNFKFPLDLFVLHNSHDIIGLRQILRDISVVLTE
jgi:uncharacterized membrane protein